MNVTAHIRQDADPQERRRQLAQLLAARGARQISEHPVSRGQQALWFLHEAAPESPAYTVVCALRLRGALDEPALRRALQRIVDRHQQLRAGFHMQADGQLIQRIHGWREVALPRTQLPPMPAPELERVLMQAVARPFDLAQGPLFRPELFQIGPQEHILLLSVHHIVFDGWSLWLVMDELRQAYAAEAEGRDTGWSPLPMSYVDHLTAQEAMIASDDADAALAFWRDRLAGAQGVLDLPLDAPRPPLRAVRGESLRLALPPALSQSLGGLARSLGVTSFSLLLGAWQILLARWSGQDTVPVGTRSAGRGDPRAAGVVGYFVNPVVVVGHVDRAMRASDYLRATHAEVLEALAHDALPFPTLVERLQVPRDPSTTPLFQASFVLQKAQRGGGAMEMMAGAADWAGLGVEFVDLPQQAGQFDLDLDMFEVGDSLRGVLKYDAALFHPDSIARLAESFATLLAALVEDCDRPIDDLPIVGAASLEQIARFSAPVAEAIPATECVHEVFERQVRATPDATALICDGRVLSYDALNRRANRLAHRLIAEGVRPGDLVGLCSDRDFDIMVGILGILKAGAGYLPLDPALPEERVNYIIGDSRAAVIVHQDAQRAVVANAGARLIALVDGQCPGDWAETDPHGLADLDGRIYVMYTSGTTGRPKGVQLTHRNVARLFLNTAHWYRFGADDVWCLFHSFAFDVSVWEMWGALCYGGRLVIVPYLVSRSPALFVDLVRDQGVTILNQSPSAFKLFVAEEGARPVPERFAMRAIVFAGEALDLQSLRPWAARHGDEMPLIVNMYGITETTVHASYRVTRKADLERARSQIGVAIPDLRLDLLDHRLRPVPIGATGEIHVSGPGLSLGYLGRPELTSEKFVTGPDGVLYYKSSDLARYTPDGDIEYLGRNDKQVKIRGFRIELGEIEGALCRHPDVQSAIAVTQDHPGQGRRIVAYVVMRAGAMDERALRAHLAQALPDYMMPAVFMEIDDIPLTGNGKLNHALLPEPVLHRDEAEAMTPPRNPAEARLAAIWERVLGVAPIGMRDDFFRLGGHSLLAVHLMSEIGAAFGQKLPTAILFRNPTIEQMAEHLGADTAAPWSPVVPMNAGADSLPALFCVAGGGGNTLYYQGVASGLSDRLRFYGLQLRGTDGQHAPHDSVEGAARDMVAAIRQVQPQGPYMLAGHCFGALVAYETARLLEAGGDTVAHVVVMDAPAPLARGAGLNVIEDAAPDDADWLAAVAGVLAASAETVLVLDAAEIRAAGDGLSLAAERLAGAGLLPAAAARDLLGGFVSVFKANSRARFQADQAIAAPISLIRAGEAHPDYDYSAAEDDPDGASSSLGWRALSQARGAVHQVAGNHLTMLSPKNSGAVARRLAAILELD
ncbi:amino acid adenylation domain-containing protein [Paracoccus mangrovi]|uniref:Amino acid adenylation domain-containing protein n=1 Tax=Paracoccus mangrovi TaxID=1715645 RepID=A0ABV7R5Y1_9RHOB